ncbi:MAG: hypothetical protein ACRDA7_02785 [Metamycoplasmataceae bacterium]
MFKKLKSIFKLNSKKRWFIVSILSFLSLLFVSLGSVFLLNNSKTSNIYQNGANITYTISDSSGEITDKNRLEENKDDLIKRLELLYPQSNYQALIPYIESGTNNSLIANQSLISVDVTKINTNDELLTLKELITKKTQYSIIEFKNSKQEYIPFDLKNPNFIKLEDIFKDAQINQNKISLISNGKYPSLFANGSEYLIIKNINNLIKEINENQNLYNSFTSTAPDGANQNLFKFLFYIQPSGQETEKPINGILKTKQQGEINSIDYLVSINKADAYINLDNNSSFALGFEKYLPDQSSKFYNETFYDLKHSVKAINYKIISSSFLTAKNGTNVFLFLLIAAGVILTLVAIFLLVNYGLLGFLNIISTALLIFLTLLMISVFRGDYDPLSILLILASSIFSLVFNFGFFERIKKEIKNGIKADKAIFKANKLFFKSSFLTQIIQIILSLVIFFITPPNLQIFSGVLLIQSLFSFFISFVGLRWCIRLLAKTVSFENLKPWFIGIWTSPKKLVNIQETNEIRISRKNSNPLSRITVEKNYLKYSKGTLIGTIALLFISLIAFMTFGLINSSALSSFNLSNVDRDRTVLIFNKGNDKPLSRTDADYVINQINESKKFDSNTLEIRKESANTDGNQFIVFASVNNLPNDLKDFALVLATQGIEFYRYILPDSNIQQSILDSIYIGLAAIGVMTVFILIRYKYPSALSVFLSMIIGIPFFILSFILFQIPINMMFSPIIIIASIWFIINLCTIINRINEKIKTKNINILEKVDLKKIAVDSIRDKIRELIKINLLFIFVFLIATVFVGVLSWTVTIPLIMFALLSFAISVYVLPFIYVQIENFKIKRKRKRIETNFWDVEVVKEQVFISFNDIK